MTVRRPVLATFLVPLAMAFITTACNTDGDTDVDTDSDVDSDIASRADRDGDRFTEEEGDCDDDDPSVYPRPFATKIEIFADEDEDGEFEFRNGLLEFAYDDAGRNTRIYQLSQDIELETTTAFNDAGQRTERVERTISSAGRPTGVDTATWTYDDQGRPKTYVRVNNLDDESENDIRENASWTYDPSSMQSAYEETNTTQRPGEEPVTQSTATGTYEYDAEARLIRSTHDTFTPKGFKTTSVEQTFAFDSSGNQTVFLEVVNTHYEDGRGDRTFTRKKFYTYDGANNLVEERAEFRDGLVGEELSGRNTTKTTTYDPDGHITNVSEVAVQTTGERYEYHLVYDRRLLQTEETIRSGYSDPSTNSTRIVRWSYDEQDRPTKRAGEVDIDSNRSIDEVSEQIWTYNDQDSTGESLSRFDYDNDGTWDEEYSERLEFDALGNESAIENATSRIERQTTMICF